MTEVTEPVMVSFTISGEQGHFALYPGPGDKLMKLEEYLFQPLLGGHCVLAVPRNATDDGKQVACPIFTRCIWPQRTEEQIARGYCSGVVWSHEATVELSLEELVEGERSHHTHQLDLAIVSAYDDDPTRVISGRRTTVQKLVCLHVSGL